MTDSLPNGRVYYTRVVVSMLSVERRTGGFAFIITRRGKDHPVSHYLSDAEAAALGTALQDPESFGIVIHTNDALPGDAAPERT